MTHKVPALIRSEPRKRCLRVRITAAGPGCSRRAPGQYRLQLWDVRCGLRGSMSAPQAATSGLLTSDPMHDDVVEDAGSIEWGAVARGEVAAGGR